MKIKKIDEFEIIEKNDSVSIKDIERIIKNLKDKNVDEKDFKILIDMAKWFRNNFKSLMS
ncbi:hypothetical protein M0Q97_11875 [Candidatus Dojkabacteria bacterium]|jgi:phage anti-repressor protein|nr:hypothetical protein [Candidatus Dojkabacteria bacterium]